MFTHRCKSLKGIGDPSRPLSGELVGLFPLDPEGNVGPEKPGAEGYLGDEEQDATERDFTDG